jgi:hypothetical protein
MKGKNRQEWLDKGYQMISESDFTSVNIESIARVINKNKSSFYHYFGDWTGFEVALLEHHIESAKRFAFDVKNCKDIIPDMMDVFLAHKIDIFFHKKLRINREKPHYKRCFESAYTMFEDAVLDKWVIFIKLEGQSLLAAQFLSLLCENFLLQITQENFNHLWLKKYLLEASKLMQNMNSQKKD